MIIIGITGTLGAGKGTIVEYLMKEHGFHHYSVRGFLMEELNKRGMPANRDTMVQVANELRAQNTPSYIVEQLYEQAVQSGFNCIIESIRTPGEADALHHKGNFSLLSVDANPETRYARITERKSETDHISFETFLENEKREMSNTDPNKQNLSACIAMSDFQLHNEGSFEALHKQLETILNQIMVNS
jgi:dephospho-CoA kinase